MHSWTSLTALSILLGVGPTYLQMDTDLDRSEGFERIEALVNEAPPGLLPDHPQEDGACWQQHWAPLVADLARRLGHCSEDVGTSTVVSFFFLMALLDLAVFFKLVFRFGCWCRQMVSKSTSTSHVVQQLRLPYHPEHFEIHSEDEETTPRPVAMEDLEMQHLRLQLEEARAQIQAVEKDLLEQKEMNAILKEELREKEVQSDDAVAVLQAELQVSQKELLECQEEANVMRVQLDALAELRNGKVPCQECLSVFADWLKESFKEMAVQIPRQLQVIHDPTTQQLRSQHFSLRKMVTSTSSTRSKSGHDGRVKKAELCECKK